VNNPPASEILSADALNIVLDHLIRMQASGVKGPSVALDESTLKQINVRPESRNGNVGLLKNETALKWPGVLQNATYEKERNRLERFIPKAVKGAAEGNVDPGTLKTIQDDLEKMQETVSLNINKMSTGKYIEAKRYLNQVEDAVRVFGQPDAIKYFNHTYEAKGKTVAELVNYMKEKGLRFAPAVATDDGAYRALHSAMVNYDLSLAQLASGAGPNQ
jgi:hypothetical protein